jgi:hypothetical protein
MPPDRSQRYCNLSVFELTFPTVRSLGGHHETQTGADFGDGRCAWDADFGDRRFMEQGWWWRSAVAVMAVVATVVVVMAVATPQAVMVVDTGAAVVMAVDTSGVDTSADVILPAFTMALLISVRATSVKTTGLRAGTSSVEIILTTMRSATGTAGIILPGSAGPAGAAGVAAGVAGEAGSDRCSGRFF